MPAKRLIDRIYTKVFLRDHAYIIPLAASTVLQLGIWAMLWYYWDIIYRPDREFFALHYKVQYGIDFLAPWYYIFAIPLFGLIVILINAIIARYGHLHERFGMHLAMIGAVAVQLILLWSLYLIIQVNIF